MRLEGNVGVHTSRVRSYLKGALPECELTAEALVKGYDPLIFLRMTHLMVAFAFACGDTRVSYRALYDSFRRYYTQNRSRLDALDLSFVLCVSSDTANLDEFRSELETDVYFCRKYVLALDERLEDSFDRLPFLPLGVSSQSARRPPTAQTYMQQCGVPAALARQLAVPHQRSARRIARDCIEGDNNVVPTLAGTGEGVTASRDGTRYGDQVRLAAITISGFRAYKRPQVFDLSGDVTVVYGPNGFGKTSLFDAIDFVATGGVGRLGLSSTTDRFARAVAHLDTKVQDGSVSLVFGTNGVKSNISRRIDSRASATLDGAVVDRKRALVTLTGGGVTPDDRIEHLVSLFRATHLFSQENQELAREFSRDCSLPPHVISQMLAFEDYANARRKAKAVCQVIQESITQRKTEIEALQRTIREAERVILSLNEASVAYGHTADPTEALTELLRRSKENGIGISSENLDHTFVRSCRATIQAKLVESDSKARRLSELVDRVQALPSVFDGLEALRSRQTRIEDDLLTANGTLDEANEATSNARAIVNKLSEERASARVNAESLKWLRATQPRYANLLQRKSKYAEVIVDGQVSFQELRERRSELNRELSRKEKQAADTESRLVTISVAVVELHQLAELAARVKHDRARISTLNESVASCNQRLREFRAEQRAGETQLGRRTTECETIQREISKMEQDQSALDQLLSRIGTYVDGPSCPLCGHDHGSTHELTTRIRARPIRDLSANLRSDLDRARDMVKESTRQLVELQEAVEREEAKIEEFIGERVDCSERVMGFEKTAARLGVGASDPTSVLEEISRRQVSMQEEIEEKKRINGTLRSELRETRVRVDEIGVRLEAAESAVDEAQHAIGGCDVEIAQLRDNPNSEVVSLQTEAATIEELDRLHTVRLKKIEVDFSEAVDRQRRSRDAASSARQRISTRESTLDNIRSDIVTRRKAIAETNARLKECGLGVKTGGADVVALLDAEAKRSGILRSLSDFADSVEVALDTATTAAALQQQRRSIREKERRIEGIVEEVSTHEEWADYFAELNERVAATQNTAIKDFASGYGPIASAIQQRLRPVYGFHGIDTRSNNSTIQVRVRRGEETLMPTDYFSHSQQQTLLLGLFLTAGMSQSWSSLSAMVLDDPITHFDDLNTYAFFDMIVGLLDARWGPEQFIMSTCDQKVFHLARSKFRFLGPSAKFYGISGIGNDGPVVEEIPSG